MNLLPDLTANQGNQPEMVDTFLGKMPNVDVNKVMPMDREHIDKLMYQMLGFASPLSVIESALPKQAIMKSAQVAKKGIEYLQPGKAAEKFREGLGEGTTKENIENLGKRVELAKKSSLEESLIPKRELFSKEAKSEINPENYLSDENVTDYYSKKGKINSLHEKFKDKPSLENYDSLQSAIKDEIRKLSKREKKGTIGDVAEKKLEQYKINVDNLNKDISDFTSKLPENLKNLEKLWRTKYATNVAPYEEAGSTIRKLAEGKWEEVSPDKITKVFTHPNKDVLKVLQDLGPSAGKNIIYNAIQKIPKGDAEKMAKTILDLKRTKGFDRFISKDMESWANKMLSHVKKADLIKKALTASAGASAGGAIFGPAGAIAGATLPFAKEGAERLAKYLIRK